MTELLVLLKIFIIFLIIFMTTSFISVFILVVKIIDKVITYKNRKLDIDKYIANMDIDIDENYELLLDKIINTCFDEYKILNLIIKPDWYIKEDEEIVINKEVASLVAQRLSPVIMEKLKVLYNEEAIFDIIAKKVHFIVTNYVIDHNRTSGH